MLSIKNGSRGNLIVVLFLLFSIIIPFANSLMSYTASVVITPIQWLSGWDKRVKITLDPTDVDAPLYDFPVLIHLSSSSGVNGDDVTFIFDELQNDANRRKIAVTTDNKISQCYVEIERWDTAIEQAWLWVKVPTVNDTAETTIYLYYDEDHADNTNYVGDPNSSVAENVWDSNFLAVHHMEEDPSATITDSTGNNEDMTSTGGMTSSNLLDAKIGKGVNFDGINDAYISQSSVAITQFAFSGWIRGDNFGAWRTVATIGEQRDMCLENGVLTFWANDQGFSFGSLLATGTWRQVTLTYDGTTLRGYVDGSFTGNSYIVSLNSYSGTLQFGRWLSNYDYYDGMLDEIRISNITRSSEWIRACYESGRDNFLDFGNEEIA